MSRLAFDIYHKLSGEGDRIEGVEQLADIPRSSESDLKKVGKGA